MVLYSHFHRNPPLFYNSDNRPLFTNVFTEIIVTLVDNALVSTIHNVSVYKSLTPLIQNHQICFLSVKCSRMETLRLALVTWNVGGGPSGVTPGTETLLSTARHADIIVVSLQEAGVGRRGWKSTLAKALGQRWAYIGGESYAGLRLRVFAVIKNGKPSAHIFSQGMKVGAGFADRLPNKGAIAVEIRFAPSCRVLFVAAHLAANEDHVVERRHDWHAILKRLDRADFLSRKTDRLASVPLFHRYDHVFVFGDLNYRIEAPGLDHNDRIRWVMNTIERQEWKTLLSLDQLTRERLAEKAFANFQEAAISFAPTFKIDPRSGHYSTSRVPSYCDRVLWHSLPACVPLLVNKRYQPLSEFRQSDHLPVIAEFQLRFPSTLSPYRVLKSPDGFRVVLEFQLVRFVKRRKTVPDVTTVIDLPSYFRRIPTPPITATHLNYSITSRNERVQYTNPLGGSNEFSIERSAVQTSAGPTVSENPDFTDSSESKSEARDGESVKSGSYSTWSYNSTHERDYSLDFSDAANGTVIRSKPPDTSASASSTYNISLPMASSSSSQFIHPDQDYDGHFYMSKLTRHLSTSSSAGDPIMAPMTASPLSQKLAVTSHVGGSHLVAQASQTSSGETSESSEDMKSADMSGTPDCSLAQSSSVPRKRDSLSHQVHDRRLKSKKKKRSRIISMRMEVHGYGLFMKRGKVYRIPIPKRRNGRCERIGESLPVIPFQPVLRIEDLEHRHVMIVFGKPKSRAGMSGALPLKELLASAADPYAFELTLTKYGQPVGTLEACVQLTIRPDGCWVDSKNRVIRNTDGGSAKHYSGPLSIRKKTRAKTKADSHK